MSENTSKIYYDPHMQCLWSEGWDRLVPIEEVEVGRVNGYDTRVKKLIDKHKDTLDRLE